MIPMITRPLIILISAKPMTIMPALLKNIPILSLFIFIEVKLSKDSTGKVPNAKASMVSPPVKKFPVERV